MTSAQEAGSLTFEAPGPGSDKQDPVHFPRPVTRYWAEMHPRPFARGSAEFARYYGMLIGALEMAYVNGFAYRRQLPAPEEEIPQRFQRAAEVMERKLWREQLREWDETVKPTAIAQAPRAAVGRSRRALRRRAGRVPAPLPRPPRGDDLPAHALHGGAIVPTGDFLAHVGDWTGLPPAELLGLMRGAAPVSAGASAELAALIAAIGDDAAAQELLASDGDPGEIARGAARARQPGGHGDVGYLDLVGYRLLDGFDISGRYALELPDVAAARDPHRRRGRGGGRGRRRRRPPTSAPRCPRSTGPSSTSCSARRG